MKFNRNNLIEILFVLNSLLPPHSEKFGLLFSRGKKSEINKETPILVDVHFIEVVLNVVCVWCWLLLLSHRLRLLHLLLRHHLQVQILQLLICFIFRLQIELFQLFWNFFCFLLVLFAAGGCCDFEDLVGFLTGLVGGWLLVGFLVLVLPHREYLKESQLKLIKINERDENYIVS